MKDFHLYRGDGTTPPGAAPVTRDESGCYLADAALVNAVNTALAVELPLLLTGEPGTGKTSLAWSVASELGLGEVLEFHTRSEHQARDACYSFDNLLRFYHAQQRDEQAADARGYVRYHALGEAIRSAQRRVVLIDEIDKAPRDFPNDLLDEIDRMAFTVRETGDRFAARHRPVVLITSNSERQLPDPFLRRCVFHHLEFPDSGRLHRILRERVGPQQLPSRLAEVAIARFLELRKLDGLEKKPSASELVIWVRVLIRAGVDPAHLAELELAELPSAGALVKTRSDLLRLAQQRKSAA